MLNQCKCNPLAHPEPSRGLEGKAGEVWRKVKHELETHGVKFPLNFNGIGGAYGAYVEIGNALLSERTALVEEIRQIDWEENHICAFNDGEQTCDCLAKILKVINNFLTKK